MKKLRYQSLNSVNYKWVKIAFKKVLIKKITVFSNLTLLKLTKTKISIRMKKKTSPIFSKAKIRGGGECSTIKTWDITEYSYLLKSFSRFWLSKYYQY